MPLTVEEVCENIDLHVDFYCFVSLLNSRSFYNLIEWLHAFILNINFV